MKTNEQKKLLGTFMDQVKDNLLSGAQDWPENWDGFELRALVAEAIKYETHDIKSRMGKKRTKEFNNDVLINNHYPIR